MFSIFTLGIICAISRPVSSRGEAVVSSNIRIEISRTMDVSMEMPSFMAGATIEG